MRIRVLVADQSEARFYDTDSVDAELQPCGELHDPKAHLHNRDLVSDRPGRVFDHAPPASGRRGSVAHHATGGEETPRKHEADVFAHQIAERLAKDLRERQFDRLVLMAGPALLGSIRLALSDPVRAAVVAEVHKDLIHNPTAAVREHLPAEVFRRDL